MEVSLAIWQIAIMCWGMTVIGILIGWLIAAWCISGKLDDLEMVIDAQQERIQELRMLLRQEIAR